jgi:3-oxoacyl-[acyl-carrier-protein] synthase II
MYAFITGIGWVTATSMGCGRHHKSFELKAGKLPEITRKEVFDAPYPHFGRLDKYSRIGLSGIAFALKDAGLDQWTHPRPISVIASTVHGCLDTDLDFYDTVMPENGRLASPNLFAYTLPNTYLGEAAIRFGLTGTSFIINNSTISCIWGLRMALIGMSVGQYETVICGGCDTGHNPSFSILNEEFCGALFFVIEKRTKGDWPAYGELIQENNGMLSLDGTSVSDLPCLAKICVAAIR